MCRMTDQQARYDRIADGYATWWSPVHREATLRLLDEADEEVAAGARRVLDVGCGTGAMAVAAAGRWPSVVVDGVDASDGMLAIARRELDAIPGPIRDRVRYRQGYADRLPFDDGTFDVVLSAFVLQLVPSRPRALREMRRVLRPGGRLAYVRWLHGDASLAADAAYDEALVAAGLEPRDPGNDHPDLVSPEAALAQLRNAGFRRVTARVDRLEHGFTPEGFAGFITRFDDEDLFRTMAPGARAELEADLLRRLRALPPDGLRLVLPIVYASGCRG
jgi:ubiquinone/menaquinone biosynthesis C-methylase UbiE